MGNLLILIGLLVGAAFIGLGLALWLGLVKGGRR